MKNGQNDPSGEKRQQLHFHLFCWSADLLAVFELRDLICPFVIISCQREHQNKLHFEWDWSTSLYRHTLVRYTGKMAKRVDIFMLQLIANCIKEVDVKSNWMIFCWLIHSICFFFTTCWMLMYFLEAKTGHFDKLSISSISKSIFFVIAVVVEIEMGGLIALQIRYSKTKSHSLLFESLQGLLPFSYLFSLH